VLRADFLPRLQATAEARYGIDLTDRTFRRWTEVGLVPGPAPPKGRGRGRSPERHWPIAAYRRALRICRYQSRGMRRETQWWIWLWLSGEEIASERVKACLRREHRRARRQSRTMAESGFLRSAGPTSFSAMPGERPADPLYEFVETLIQHPAAGLTADLQRGVHRATHNELEPEEAERIFQNAVAPLLGHDVTARELGVELDAAWTAGHLGEGLSAPDAFIEGATAADLALTREVVLRSILFTRIFLPNADLMGQNIVSGLLFIFSMTLGGRWIAGPAVVDHLLRTLFGIRKDRECGVNPARRLVLADDNLAWAKENCEMLSDRSLALKYFK